MGTRTTSYRSWDGLELVCSELGEGPPVLLLHAGGERRSVFLPVVQRLAHAGWRAIAVDQRGHGETGGRGVRLDDHVRDACAILERVDSPAWVVGNSLGGFVALLAAARLLTRGVVLLDVIPDVDPDRARAYLKTIERKERPWDWALVEDILSCRPMLVEAASGLQVAMMLIRGEQGIVRDEDVLALHSEVPGLAVCTIARAGHLVARDQPEALGEALVSMLREQG